MQSKKSVAIIILTILIPSLMLVGYFLNRQFDSGINSSSFKVDRSKALIEIQALPEVIEYQNTLGKAGKKANFTIEDNEDSWSVQVFEVVQNPGEQSHTATFGWYSVNKNTGEISKDL